MRERELEAETEKSRLAQDRLDAREDIRNQTALLNLDAQRREVERLRIARELEASRAYEVLMKYGYKPA